MDRERVARLLDEIAALLQLRGDNPFKTRAYDNAARVLRGMDRDLGELVARRQLTSVKGIGKAIAEKIETLVREGRLPYLDALREEVPPGLLDWLRLPGMGAKKARLIHVSLGIGTMNELEQACRAGRLRELPGFGEASERKLLAAIARQRGREGRFLRPVAVAEARRLLDVVRGVPGVRRAEAAGSVRRCVETSRDIDLVVSAEDPEAVMDAFAAASGVEEIVGRGPTKCSVRLAAGPGADLRVVDETSYPAALVYFTGSKAHNIALRGRAQRRGMRLNEYALAREDDGTALDCADERAIYARLGIDSWIAPELREDLGEIEAAERGELPHLVEPGDLRGILHVHSDWSDGTATIAELGRAAAERGAGYLAITDHSQSAVYANGLDPSRLAAQREEIDRVNDELGGTLRLLHGVEVDVLADGSLDLPDDALSRLDLVIASVHGRFDLDETRQTERLLRAVDHPLVDVLGHVTGRKLLRRDGYALDLPRVLDRAALRGVAVEINAHPRRLDLDWRHLRYGLERGMKTCICPDAHSTAALDDVAWGVDVARKGWCTVDDVLNAWPLERLLEHLRRRRLDAGAGGDGGS